MTISIIDIKFYIVHCLFMVVLVVAKLITARCVCNIERAPYFMCYTIELGIG